MQYEVRTLEYLNSAEVIDSAFAHTVVYRFRREAESHLLAEGDLYRICLQDHRILPYAGSVEIDLETLLIYVLTHELVHVVRFGRRMQEVDLPGELRPSEEQRVEQTTRAILVSSGLSEFRSLFSTEESDHNPSGAVAI